MISFSGSGGGGREGGGRGGGGWSSSVLRYTYILKLTPEQG